MRKILPIAIICVLITSSIGVIAISGKSYATELSTKDIISISKPKLIGAEIEVSGNSRISSFDNKIEIVASKSRFLDSKSEAKRLLEILETD